MSLNYTCLSFDQLSKSQLYDIMQLRQEVFVVEQDCPYLDADGKDQGGFHLFGHNEEDQILAYTRLLPKGISYADYCSIGRVVTSSKVRGKGEGIILMKKSIEQCKLLFPGQTLKISAQCYLDAFYKKLDFVPTGDNYLEDDIPHQAMIYTAP